MTVATRRRAALGGSLLLADPDPAFAAALIPVLAGAGYLVSWARSAQALSHLARTQDFEVCVLDRDLATSAAPTDGSAPAGLRGAGLLVTLPPLAPDRLSVLALEAGADDCVRKPVATDELLARLRVLVRRRAGVAATRRQDGPLRLDQVERSACYGARSLLLRPREFDLLWLLLGQAGRAVARQDLMGEIWGRPDAPHSRTLDVHVARLRQAFAAVGVPRDRISTVRGYGFRYDRDLP